MSNPIQKYGCTWLANYDLLTLSNLLCIFATFVYGKGCQAYALIMELCSAWCAINWLRLSLWKTIWPSKEVGGRPLAEVYGKMANSQLLFLSWIIFPQCSMPVTIIFYHIIAGNFRLYYLLWNLNVRQSPQVYFCGFKFHNCNPWQTRCTSAWHCADDNLNGWCNWWILIILNMISTSLFTSGREIVWIRGSL